MGELDIVVVRPFDAQLAVREEMIQRLESRSQQVLVHWSAEVCAKATSRITHPRTVLCEELFDGSGLVVRLKPSQPQRLQEDPRLVRSPITTGAREVLVDALPRLL